MYHGMKVACQTSVSHTLLRKCASVLVLVDKTVRFWICGAVRLDLCAATVTRSYTLLATWSKPKARLTIPGRVLRPPQWSVPGRRCANPAMLGSLGPSDQMSTVIGVHLRDYINDDLVAFEWLDSLNRYLPDTLSGTEEGLPQYDGGREL